VESAFLAAVETHDVGALRRLLGAGLDARAPLRGKLPLDWLLEMYARSERFPDCVRALLDAGAAPPEPALAAVLLDDETALAALPPARLRARVSLRSAFTPLEDATLLHVAAEFQCERALRALLGVGLEVDARAGLDAHGLGGHSALFHTVNSNANRAGPLMQLLLDAGARVDTRVAGLVWGRGFEWETACFDLTPIAFAQLGCLPQMHRDERQIADNVRRLLAAAERDPAAVRNVPNRYLAR
jgi:ankyrin repeat protein